MKNPLKLIIVEDEDYVVSGLKRHIDWNSLGIDIVGTASDGETGMKSIIKLNPDLVLVDIRMPVMDGITMIQRLNDMDIKPLFIIFSGYDDFGYAKSAIKYGVVDYILKPSLPEEIAQVLNKAAEKCRRAKILEDEQNKMKEQFNNYKPVLYSIFTEELFHGNILMNNQLQQKCKFLGLDIMNKHYCVATVHIDNWNGNLNRLSEEQEQYILYIIASYAAKVFESYKTFTNFKNSFAHFLMARQPDGISKQIVLKQASEIVKYCNDKFDISVSIGISNVIDEFTLISNAYEQSVECLKYNLEYNKIIFFSELDNNSGCPLPGEIYNKDLLNEAIKLGDAKLVQECLAQFFRNVKRVKWTHHNYLTPLIYEMLGATAMTLIHMGMDYDSDSMIELTKPSITVNELEEKLTAYYGSLMQKLKDNYFKKNFQIIQKILGYVKENYNREITLNEIANRIYFTPNYLSTLFSKSMGESFSSYFTRYRMQKAKELLESGKYKVYEVSEMVGYKNTDYFSKTFKELIGISPSSYKK